MFFMGSGDLFVKKPHLGSEHQIKKIHFVWQVCKYLVDPKLYLIWKLIDQFSITKHHPL